MSPDQRRAFEADWPELAKRLHGFLARKGVPSDQRDDLVQETAVRLVGMWDYVDRSRGTWALTLTIALNLLRDGARRAHLREVVCELPDLASLDHVEDAGLARVELRRVEAALEKLSSGQRSALLTEVGCGPGIHSRDNAAQKMLRLRARKRLGAAVGRVSTGLAIRWRRLGDVFQAAVGAEHGTLQGLACALCFALGLTMTPGTGSALDSGRDSNRTMVSTDATSELESPSLGLRRAASRVLAPEMRPRTPPARARRSLRVGKQRADDSGTAPSDIPELPIGRGLPENLPLPDDDSVGRPPVPEPPPAPDPPPAPPVPRIGGRGSDSPDVVKNVAASIAETTPGGLPKLKT